MKKPKRTRELIPAAEVRRVRKALKKSQAEFALIVGVSARTIVRAEQRGLEVSSRDDTRRPEVFFKWSRCAEAAAGKGGRR